MVVGDSNSEELDGERHGDLWIVCKYKRIREENMDE